MLESDKNLIASALHILMEEAHINAVNKGFWETAPDGRVLTGNRNKAEMMALEHSEISERLEAVREMQANPDMNIKDRHCPDFTSEEIECADLAIRLFDYCRGFNIRLAEAIFAKHQYNTSRPYKHGKAF